MDPFGPGKSATSGSSAEFAVGSNAYFAELNRNRPETADVDAIVYPITPQVHASDETSMMENLEAQAVTVQTARSWAGQRQLVVSPVTLKPRFNANATEPESVNTPRELPVSVDPRQCHCLPRPGRSGV